MGSEEAKLKKVLTRSDLFAIAVGQIIGAGIMTLTGVAIGITGAGVVFAFIISAILAVIRIMPHAILGSTLPTTGGGYRYTSRLLSPQAGCVYICIFILGQLSIGLYAVSIGSYALSLWPSINPRWVAFGFLTFFYISNIIGIRGAANVQKIMFYVLLVSLLMFVIFGLPKVDFSTFTKMETLFPNGLKGFMSAIALLAFATGGGQVIVEIGGEMKNPQRDIAFVMITSTIGCGILYAAMSAVAAGVLPIEQVADKPLTDVARIILPKPLFYFFIFGGALFALATTLNAQLGWASRSPIIACEDGWFPKSIGIVNEKYGTPIIILTLLYIVGLTPIVLGWTLGTIARLSTGISSLQYLLVAAALLYLPKKYPKEYKESRFHVGSGMLKFIAVASILINIVYYYLLVSPLPLYIIIGSSTLLVLFIAYAYIRGQYLKKEGRLERLGF